MAEAVARGHAARSAGDVAAAVAEYRAAAAAGHADGLACLGRCYQDGFGVGADAAEAERLYRAAIAADAANGRALLGLGWILSSSSSSNEGALKEAVALLERAVASGRFEAKLFLGLCYSKLGRTEEARRSYRAAAEEDGDTAAMTHLALLYTKKADGDGGDGDDDPAQARLWLQRAADAGSTAAMTHLALLYTNKTDGDPAQARAWMRRAAEAGEVAAMVNLAILLSGGDHADATETPPEAIKWFKRAADAGDSTALHRLGLCFLNGDGVARDMAEGVRLIRAGAEVGDYATAMASLGECYQEGTGVAVDLAEAGRWYARAAERGHAVAQYRLATFILQKALPSATASQDLARAVALLEAAAAQGHTGAMFNLAMCHRRGDGVPAKSETEAARWFAAAAQAGHPTGMASLGLAYLEGNGVPKNSAEAVRWFRAAAEAGVGRAAYNLGVCYTRGVGVARNAAEAAHWIQRARQLGLDDLDDLPPGVPPTWAHRRSVAAAAALVQAITARRASDVRRLLADDPSLANALSGGDDDDVPVLQLAITVSKSPEVVLALVEAGASLHTEHAGVSYLTRVLTQPALVHDRLYAAIVERLGGPAAVLGSRDVNGWTAAHVAAAYGTVAIWACLARAAGIDAAAVHGSPTLLHAAADGHNVVMYRHLLPLVAPEVVMLRDEDGATAAEMYAALANRLPTYEDEEFELLTRAEAVRWRGGRAPVRGLTASEVAALRPGARIVLAARFRSGPSSGGSSDGADSGAEGDEEEEAGAAMESGEEDFEDEPESPPEQVDVEAFPVEVVDPLDAAGWICGSVAAECEHTLQIYVGHAIWFRREHILSVAEIVVPDTPVPKKSTAARRPRGARRV